MSFFDKAKQAATEMAAKADQAMANAGISGPPGGIAGSLGGAGAHSADAALRDYGLISWREAHGQPVDASEKERVLGALRDLEASGSLAALRVTGGATGSSMFGAPAPGAPPPPPGAAAAAAAARSAGPDGGVGGAGAGAGAGAGGGSFLASPPPPPAPAAPTAPPAPPAQEPPVSGGGTAPPPPPPSWAG